MDPEHFASERLRYDRLGPGDVDDVFAVYGDPETWLHLPEGRFTDRAQAIAMLERSDASWGAVGLGEWAVRAATAGDGFAAGAFLGVVAATEKSLGGGRRVLNLGYRFAPSAWGRGFAGEAARAVLAAVGEAGTGLPLTARVLGNNASSIRVLDRLPLRLVWRGASRPAPGLPATVERERLIYADRALDADVLAGVIDLG